VRDSGAAIWATPVTEPRCHPGGTPDQTRPPHNQVDGNDQSEADEDSPCRLVWRGAVGGGRAARRVALAAALSAGQYLAFVAGIIAASASASAWIDGPGMVGLVLPMSGAEYFGETIGVPIVLLATGVLLIVLMVLLHHRGTGHRPLLP